MIVFLPPVVGDSGLLREREVSALSGCQEGPRGCRVAWGHPRLRLRRLYSSFLLTRPAQTRQCRPRERARPYFPPPSNLRTPFTACSTRSCGQTDSRPPSFAYIPKVRTVPWRSFRGSVTN